MSKSTNQTAFVVVPCDEQKQEPIYNKENHIHLDGTGLSQKRPCKLWKKALIIIMFIFFGSRLLFHRNSLYSNNKTCHGVPVTPLKIYEPHTYYESSCNPSYKWNGPSELLIDPSEVSGLIFNVKGMASHGSVLIRHDPNAKFITVNNKIYLSEESLQNEVDIKIDIIDEDYIITIETPSFDGPRPTAKCVHVDTIITFPKQVNFWRSLVIDVPNGWVTINDLKNIEFAYVGLKTRNGDIMIKDLNSAVSEIATINGLVHGSIVTAEALDIRTVNGNIDINVIVNEFAEHVGITTKSINGHVEFNLNDDQTIDIKAGSVNGGILVIAPDSYVGDFSATTLIGYSYVSGSNTTFTKNMRNTKIGYKTKSGDDDESDSHRQHQHRHRHHEKNKKKSHKNRHEEFDSHLVLEAVTGAVELLFMTDNTY
ncbi:10474_t:CDS:2 [Diversispora eburnea]|uniref:10474_t:CDS:1 n=1 Tax=Diversispora eburnea TaxID=1213867 RepID=A0A9N8VQD0_9GLOM|nr:10474_t:CDS:2 [Diversispora eburnea]